MNIIQSVLRTCGAIRVFRKGDRVRWAAGYLMQIAKHKPDLLQQYALSRGEVIGVRDDGDVLVQFNDREARIAFEACPPGRLSHDRGD